MDRRLMKGYWVALYKKIDNKKNLKDYSDKVTPIIKSLVENRLFVVENMNAWRVKIFQEL